ncbi:desumoylating isopeptidase 1 [Heracleum sosnowskyi]|uniref:Desumoylating isopeptidase 1 n=1 Tax=Heracleum sosnowskyi TaxID=360622 RepID=A0AAD8GRH2_9APIA|nr:desumoylating isopeptidase 1 [Heracleum sosnowskyi]
MAEEGHKVSLNVYDLSQGMARQFSMTLLGKAIEGIWHTGIVVYGNEYYFGGGLEHSLAGATPYGTPLRVIDLGVTHVPKDVFEMYLQEISPQYTAESYNLLKHNCNNFSNDVAQFLVGAIIPEYILNLPDEVMNSPMSALILPTIERLEQTMKVGAVPQAPVFKEQTLIPDNKPTSTKVCHGPPAINKKEDESKSKSEENPTKSSKARKTTKNNDVPAKAKTAEIGDARCKLQEEITSEFSTIMASGTMSASEAAVLATQRVMEKFGHTNSIKS